VKEGNRSKDFNSFIYRLLVREVSLIKKFKRGIRQNKSKTKKGREAHKHGVEKEYTREGKGYGRERL